MCSGLGGTLAARAWDSAEEGCPGWCPALATFPLVPTGQRGAFSGSAGAERGRTAGVAQAPGQGLGPRAKAQSGSWRCLTCCCQRSAELRTSNCGMSLAFPAGSEWVSAG